MVEGRAVTRIKRVIRATIIIILLSSLTLLGLALYIRIVFAK